MPHIYAQRKRPRGQANTDPARSSAAGPVSVPLRADTAGAGNTAALDAAMKAKMMNTFVDLRALKDYRPPMRETATVPAGPYTGPVTHVISDASPSPSAAGPMQAKKDNEEEYRGKPKRAILEDDIVTEGTEGYEDLPDNLYEERVKTPGFFSKLFGAKPTYYKARIDRRPWEMTPDELSKNKYNPNNVRSLNSMDLLMDSMDELVEDPDPQTRNGSKNRRAWNLFQKYNGAYSSNIKTEDEKSWDMNDMDHGILTAKLKNMSRMVHDFPELAGHIGTLYRLPKQKKEKDPPATGDKKRNQPSSKTSQTDTAKKKYRDRKKQKKKSGSQTDPRNDKPSSGTSTTYMSTSPNLLYNDEASNPLERGQGAFPIRMNSQTDAVGEKARKKRERLEAKEMESNSQSAEMEYSGNHEMGHMLNYLLVKEKYRHLSRGKRADESQEDFHFYITAHELVEKALQETMDPKDYKNLVRYKESTLAPNEAWDPKVQLDEGEEWVTKDDEEPHKAGMINFKASNLGGKKGDRGFTSGYGATNAAEFFAEAFADVYRNGTDARPTSIRLVQLYEERMKQYKA